MNIEASDMIGVTHGCVVNMAVQHLHRWVYETNKCQSRVFRCNAESVEYGIVLCASLFAEIELLAQNDDKLLQMPVNELNRGCKRKNFKHMKVRVR